MAIFPLLPDEVARYCELHTTKEPVEVERIRLLTRNHPKAYWILGPVIAAFLRITIRILRPQRVLELGTFTGYVTAIILSEVSSQAEVTSVERDPEIFAIAEENLVNLAADHNFNLVLGEGLEWLRSHPGRQFDLILIDIDKTEIAEDFEIIARAVAPRGMLICDNALIKNKVIEPKMPWERQTDKLNDLLSRDPRFLSSLLPVRDGLNLAYRVDEDE